MVKLCLHDNDCDENIREMHEDYAKIALLMFCPFRKLEDIQLDGSYWKLFHRELQMFKNHKVTTMWLKGFEILQNIEHRRAMQHDTPKRPDIVTKNTYNKLDTEGKSTTRKQSHDEVPNIAKMDW